MPPPQDVIKKPGVAALFLRPMVPFFGLKSQVLHHGCTVPAFFESTLKSLLLIFSQSTSEGLGKNETWVLVGLGSMKSSERVMDTRVLWALMINASSSFSTSCLSLLIA